jgi:C4-type Zn-finger protein
MNIYNNLLKEFKEIDDSGNKICPECGKSMDLDSEEYTKNGEYLEQTWICSHCDNGETDVIHMV